MPPSRLPGIAADFMQLAQRFEDYLGRAVKPTHLLVNVEQSAVRAGRLLDEAAGIGAFEGDTWWRDGKSPVHPFDDGEGSSLRYESDAEFSRCLWTSAITSWLAPRWPNRFRHRAGGWDWACLETDEDGRLLDKDGNPLQVRSRGSKEGLPEDSQRPDEGLPAQDTSPFEGKIAMKHDFYDESDALEHLRIRAEVYSDACRLLAELSIASPCCDLDGVRLDQLGDSVTVGNEVETVHAATESTGRHPGDGTPNDDDIADTNTLKPSHKKAKKLYEWAMKNIQGADTMTYSELFDALQNDPQCAGEGLPDNAEAFARYCCYAGIERNRPLRSKPRSRSIRRASDL